MSFVDGFLNLFKVQDDEFDDDYDYDEEFDDDEDDDKPSARKKLFSGSKKSDDEDTSSARCLKLPPGHSAPNNGCWGIRPH